jgi:hypothetical protein
MPYINSVFNPQLSSGNSVIIQNNEETVDLFEMNKNISNIKKYLDYLSDEMNKAKPSKIEIFIVFYINVDGLSRRETKIKISELVEHYLFDESSYKINTMWIPVTNQETKVEIINPSLFNGDVIKTFKDILKMAENEEYKELIKELAKNDKNTIVK